MSRFDQAVERFGAAHREDPAGAAFDYHRDLAAWIDRLAPKAPEAMRLAAWCQHIRRWTRPRADFPAGVTGYKQWRGACARFHAEEAERVLAGAGYHAAVIDRVRDFLIKKGLRQDPEVKIFEDAVCLTFMQRQLAAFAAAHSDAEMLGILRKTWDKMSPLGREHAAALLPELPQDVRGLVQQALGTA